MKKNVILLIISLITFSINAQKVKLKKGKVYVDKKEYLTYKKNVYYTLDGAPLFTIKKESVEKDNLNTDKTDQLRIDSDVTRRINRTSDSDPQRRGDRNTKKRKIKFSVVKFVGFDLEFETSLSKSKILKEFYKKEVVNIANRVDQEIAYKVASRIRKDITGKRNN